LLAGVSISAADRKSSLQLEPERTTIHFVLGSVLLTVHGTFRLKHGALRLDPACGRLTGEIVGNGESGSGTRNRKIQREVLESDRYPDIIFRPDSVEGAVAAGSRNLQHSRNGARTHGSGQSGDAAGGLECDRSLAIPHVKWGAEKSQHIVPSVVSESVEIVLGIGGVVTQ
jgi:hypothetical protein